MRTVEQAAKDAIDGADETLWQACMERRRELGWSIDFDRPEGLIRDVIRSFSPQELSLYSIKGETSESK